MNKVISVAVGTYEGSLLVYKGCIKSVLFSNQLLYAGGRDEVLRVYNSKKRSREGELLAQAGTIEKIIKKDAYLFLSSSDGKITIYGNKDHTFYHSIKAHNKTILDFDIHSSGALMVTIGADNKMKLFDLRKVSEAYHKNIEDNIDFVRFAHDENVFQVCNKRLLIFKTETNTSQEIYTADNKINCILVNKNLVILGDESGIVTFLQYENPDTKIFAVKFRMFEDGRVKQLKFSADDYILAGISTEGICTIYDVGFILDYIGKLQGVDLDLEDKIEKLYTFSIETRLISLDIKINNKKASDNVLVPGKSNQKVPLTASGVKKMNYIDRVITKHHNSLRHTGPTYGVLRSGIRSRLMLKKFRMVVRLLSAKKQAEEENDNDETNE